MENPNLNKNDGWPIVNMVNEKGLTLHELREFINTIPDIDGLGEDMDVSIGSGNHRSCPAVALYRLNDGILIEITPYFCYPEDDPQQVSRK